MDIVNRVCSKCNSKAVCFRPICRNNSPTHYAFYCALHDTLRDEKLRDREVLFQRIENYKQEIINEQVAINKISNDIAEMDKRQDAVENPPKVDVKPMYDGYGDLECLKSSNPRCDDHSDCVDCREGIPH